MRAAGLGMLQQKDDHFLNARLDASRALRRTLVNIRKNLVQFSGGAARVA